MHIAIVGGGYAGLGVAWHLLSQEPKTSITLFDSAGIGGGASGLSAGLLHPYSGLRAKLNWKGREGVAATERLIEIAEEELECPVSQQTGILRLAINAEQELDYHKACTKYSDLQAYSAEEVQKTVPSCAPFPGFFIPKGRLVYPHLYLKGLWRACERKGARLILKNVFSLRELNQYDCIIVTNGMGALRFPELAHLPLNGVKGQLLELEWPKELPPLPMPINSNKYIVMSPDRKSCLVGATYERDYLSSEPHLEIAKKEILPEVERLIPAVKGANILACRAGLRASTPNHIPIAEKVEDNIWAFTGLGSKGLLYHAYIGQILTEQILAQ